jgi:hypothetical protein
MGPQGFPELYEGLGQKYGDYRAHMLCSKFGKSPVNIRVVVAREAYGGLVTGPERRSCSASSVPCKYRALQGHYATTVFSILLTESFVLARAIPSQRHP